jgi:hypothetical protein
VLEEKDYTKGEVLEKEESESRRRRLSKKVEKTG